MFIYRQGWNYSHSWTGPITRAAQDEVTSSSGGTPQVVVLPSARAASEASRAALHFSNRWTQWVLKSRMLLVEPSSNPREARRSRYTHRTSGSRSSTPPSTSLVLRHAHARPGPVITLPAPSGPAASTTSPSPSSRRLRHHHSAPRSKAPPTVEDTNTHRWCLTILLPSHDSPLL